MPIEFSRVVLVEVTRKKMPTHWQVEQREGVQCLDEDHTWDSWADAVNEAGTADWDLWQTNKVAEAWELVRQVLMFKRHVEPTAAAELPLPDSVLPEGA
jgi:hypothetical protein